MKEIKLREYKIKEAKNTEMQIISTLEMTSDSLLSFQTM